MSDLSEIEARKNEIRISTQVIPAQVRRALVEREERRIRRHALRLQNGQLREERFSIRGVRTGRLRSKAPNFEERSKHDVRGSNRQGTRKIREAGRERKGS